MIRLVIIVCFITIQAFGQQIKFENFTISEGLSNNSVIDIENDKDGSLWIGTLDGLNHYDGYDFTVYKHNVDNSNSIAGNYIRKIKRDTTGTIWILTDDLKICSYIGNEKFKTYFFKNETTDIYLSKKGNIVVSGKNSYSEFINGHFQASKTLVIQKQSPKAIKNKLFDSYPNAIINTVLKDKSGNIWYATRKNGLFIRKNNTVNSGLLEHYTQDPYSDYSFKSNEIETLHEDSFGNIWLGLKDGGISMAYTNSDKIASIAPHPIKFPTIPNEAVRAVTKDLAERIWLGYYTKGLFYYNLKTKSYTSFKIKEAKSQPDWMRIRSLFTASDGTVLAGTYAGIIRIKNNGDYSLYTAKRDSNLPNNRNYSIYEDANKQLWISCWGGMAKFNLKTDTFETFKGQKLLSQYHIRNVISTGGELIIGTENSGVKLLDLNNGEVHTISISDGLLSNSVYSIYKESQTNHYWIATLGGISIYDKNKGIIKNITEKDGLPSQMVYGLLSNENKVWVSTTKGIAVVDKGNLQVKPFCSNGLWQVSEFSEGAYYQDVKGVLFFGGANGLNYFNPNTIQLDTSKAKIKLVVDGNENYKTSIEKSFSDNELDIELVPIKFPVKNRSNVYYKLEGKDKVWNLLDDSNKIKYTNLASGNYTLLVKQGRNSSPEPLLFSLHIKKAFYETILFYVLLSVFIFITSIGFLFFKNRKAIAQQKKLEDQIVVRTAVIEKQKRNLQAVNDKLDEKNKEILLQKEKLLTLHNNLKNEDFEIEKFKTFVLSEFQEPLFKIIKTASVLKEDAEAQRNLIHQSGKLIDLISEWNYLNHIKDIGPVKITAINLFPVLKGSVEKLKRALQTHHVNFNCEIDTTIGWVEIDVLRFRLLLQYFFNDISKYSDAGSDLDISIRHKNNVLEIQLSSNSTILKNNWYSILHFSPYFKALQVLLCDLKGRFSNSSEEEFQVILQIPLLIIDTDVKQVETISWKHFNQHENSSSNKTNILIFSEEENYATANQILEQDNYNLIFESSVSNLATARKQISVDLIVFYQAIFSKELLYFLRHTNTEEMNRKKTPLMYISEDSSYELQEQSIELGIDTLIQLPASVSFITKKISSLINKKQVAVEENKFQQKIFDILTEKDSVITPNDKLLKRGLDIIKDELHNPSFNVEMLVEQLGVSRVKCYRLFKETLKQSPSDIIMSLRLQKAEALLKSNKLNISEISFECGYNDPKYFGRSFKKHFGKSPKEFKENLI